MKKLAISAGCLLASLTFLPKARRLTRARSSTASAPLWAATRLWSRRAKVPKDCTNRCVTMGGKYTLFNFATKTAY